MKDLLLAASSWFPRPVRYYTFEPNTVNSNVLTDVSGTQNGTIVGSPTFGVGKRGNCVKFDGNAANYINIGNVDFMHQTGIFSIVFWAKTQYTDSGQLLVIAGNSLSGVNYGFFVAFDDRPVAPRNRTLVLALFDAAGTGGGSVLNFLTNDILPIDGLYHHYALTFDNSVARAYIDGELVGTANGNRTLSNTATAAAVYLGAGNANGTASYPFNGEIDEFRISPKTLTAQQIKRLYQIGL